MTKIYNFNNKINIDELNEAAKVLLSGGLVIFPTETVYGIGANALDSNAVNKIFVAKGRASDNPLIVHIANFDMINDLVYPPTLMEQALMDAFMPGPFTLVLKKKDIVPMIVTANLNTVGIRMPDNKIAHDLIELAGVPIAAPSANISSKPSGTKIDDIKDEFMDKVDIIIDGGETKIGIESTVCKVIDGIPTILRPGKITPDDIKNVVGVVKVDNNIFTKSEGIVASPGMKYRHYAPNNKCILVYSENEIIQIDEINKLITGNTIVIGFREHQTKIKTNQYYIHGSINNYDEISHNIFSLLREVDRLNPDLIIIEGVKKEGLGIAIMNRLIRAASYNYIEK